MAGDRVWLAAAIAVIAMACAQAAPRSLAHLIDDVLRKGPDSRLPAHLSMVLGVSHGEQPTAVKQAVMRDGDTVRTFNVSSADHGDVVMITYNERTRSSKVYLLSPEGKLRKAVSFQAGAPAVERSSKDAQGEFSAEMKFWMDLQNQPAAAK